MPEKNTSRKGILYNLSRRSLGCMSQPYMDCYHFLLLEKKSLEQHSRKQLLLTMIDVIQQGKSRTQYRL